MGLAGTGLDRGGRQSASHPRSVRPAAGEIAPGGAPEGAGSRLLFYHLLQAHGIDAADLHFTVPPARSETDVALTIQDGKADVGFGIAAVARQCRLDFVPLQRERYDIAIGRRDYFQPPFQTAPDLRPHGALCGESSGAGGVRYCRSGQVAYNSP